LSQAKKIQPSLTFESTAGAYLSGANSFNGASNDYVLYH
jgi:hypothetical protein